MPKLKDILSFLFTQTAARTDELKRAGKLPQGHVPRVRLNAGTVIECSDRKYVALKSGQWVRANPKPYRNKAERKAQKRQRRAAHSMAVNLAMGA